MSEIIDTVVPYLAKWYVLLLIAVVLVGGQEWWSRYLVSRKHGCKEPPILSYPYLCLPMLIQLVKKKREGKIFEMILDVFSGSVATRYLRLAGVRVIFTKDPENIKAVLATQFNDFALGTRHAHFAPLLGDGIFTLDGEGWKHSRAMLRPQFAREQVAHVRQLDSHINTVAKIIELKKGQTFDLQDIFFKLTVDTATEFLFGESVHTLHGELPQDLAEPINEMKQGFGDNFNVAQNYLATRSYSQMFYFLINNSEFRNSIEKVHKFSSYYVDKALSTPQDELEKISEESYIFLYELVKQTRDPKVLRDQLLNVMVAGRDTTAGLLSFTFFELSRRPDILAKLKKEIYANFGDKSTTNVHDITFESMKRCEYLKFVLNEVLRLYPSVPVNFRVATKHTTLPVGGGEDGQSPVFVGKGTTIVYSVYVNHREKHVFGEDADEFRPERWAELNKLGWSYLPFNGGPRICLGQQFALTEASYVVIRLLQLFPNLVSDYHGQQDPLKATHLTMSLHDGVPVHMT